MTHDTILKSPPDIYSSHQKSHDPVQSEYKVIRKKYGIGIAAQRIAHANARMPGRPYAYFEGKILRASYHEKMRKVFGFGKEPLRLESVQPLLASRSASGTNMRTIPAKIKGANTKKKSLGEIGNDRSA